MPSAGTSVGARPPVQRRVLHAPRHEARDPEQRPRPAAARRCRAGRRRCAAPPRPAGAGKAARSSVSAASVRPECPQVTRVTIASSSDDAKPMVIACSGASPSDGTVRQLPDRARAGEQEADPVPEEADVQHREQAVAQALHEAPAHRQHQQEDAGRQVDDPREAGEPGDRRGRRAAPARRPSAASSHHGRNACTNGSALAVKNGIIRWQTTTNTGSRKNQMPAVASHW